ncbi:MAG: hypothetical protein M3R59_04675 [Verrucomicrobiota bacterium]|nr:hypothetical protein [Verrucomicrobiota bacterium]
MGNDSREIHFASVGRELNAANYRIRAEDHLGEGRSSKNVGTNFAAIELVRELSDGDRAPTDNEKRVTVKYVGEGGIPQVFADPGSPEWTAEHARLKQLLSDWEYVDARASILNAHCTSATVISAIYGAERIKFEHGRVLEPALGIGNFFGLMPACMSDHSQLLGVDPVTASITCRLYPCADFAREFATAMSPNKSFDRTLGPQDRCRRCALIWSQSDFEATDCGVPKWSSLLGFFRATEVGGWRKDKI